MLMSVFCLERVSSTQAQTTGQHRYLWPPAGGPAPAWTVCYLETPTVAGTRLIKNVPSCPVQTGRQLS